MLCPKTGLRPTSSYGQDAKRFRGSPTSPFRPLNALFSASVPREDMNVLTHFFAGWALAEASATNARDRALVTWASVLPDLDGLTVLPDLATKALGRPESDFYFRYHHVWTHGLPAAAVTAVAAFLLGRRKLRAALLCLLAFH